MTRHVWITGGAGGIGRAAAAAFLADHDRVTLADLDTPAARAVAAELGAGFVPLDVRDAESIETAVADSWPIDVLVNTAGLVGGAAGVLTDLPIEAYDLAFAVNTRGAYLVTRAVARRMIDAGLRGSIVSVTSIGAWRSTAGLGHYEASKAALDSLVRSAAVELAPHGIRVNAVAPGPVYTPMTEDALADEHERAAWEARVPMHRLAQPEDVAPAIVFLASDGARHITGVSIPVDGGQILL